MAIKIKGEVVITDGEDLTIVGNATIGETLNVDGNTTSFKIKNDNASYDMGFQWRAIGIKA